MGWGNKGVVEVKGNGLGDNFQVFVSLNYFYSPEPVVVPNFFLPPQQLEASLRMLSVSTALPPPATTDQVRGYPADLFAVESLSLQ